MKITNPIFTGFNPDPSICYADGTFYIATSTFEYKPGVVIHASKDLVNWTQKGVLDSDDLLNNHGIPASGGIWAPCIRYHEEEKLFYLIYTEFKSSYTPPFRDQANYLVTGPTPYGPWSERVFLNSSGYDPSIFFDEDGRAYITNMIWDYRARMDKMSAGIILQEYDWKERKMVGGWKMIFEGTEVGQTEGPSIYRRHGWYYLMTAEGGTDYGHRVTLCRSRDIWGPYENHPDKYVLMSGDSYLQKAGHAGICCDKDGQWWMSYLCGRPLPDKRCTTGRETSIIKVEWKDDDWLYTANGTGMPDLEVEVPDVEITCPAREHYTFEDDSFLSDFMVLRERFENGRFTLEERPGYLRIYGRESINSIMEQSVIVHRQTEQNFEAVTELEFDPKNYGHMAGLIYRYNEAHQFYCYMTYDEEKGNIVRTLGIDGFGFSLLPIGQAICLDGNHVFLKVVVNGAEGQFFCSENGETWTKVGDPFDASQLSDDYAIGFTGAMVGMACQDLLMNNYPADFRKFDYKGRR